LFSEGCNHLVFTTFSKEMISIPHLIRLEKVDSTNTYAEKLIRLEEIPEGTVIVASEQTAGKGQGDNRWVTQPGKNLTLTIVLHPRFLPAEDQFFLNMAVSLGIARFVKSLVHGDNVTIKWPNDIYYEHLKLGGVLINHFLGGSTLDTTVVGIGININQTEFDSSLPNPTSIQTITGQSTNLEKALTDLFNEVLGQYTGLVNNDTDNIRVEYLNNLLGFCVARNFMVDGKTIRGTIREVDTFGRLVVQMEDGSKESYAHKEIEYLFP
jgi:BirA family biotin operon repressor/biotin-[acetyl-CoA-carboxylase] ligase